MAMKVIDEDAITDIGQRKTSIERKDDLDVTCEVKGDDGVEGHWIPNVEV